MSKAGDYYIPLVDEEGNDVGSLPLLGASILPQGSPHNLISLFQLCSEGAHFSTSTSTSGAQLSYRGRSFPLRVKSNLILIDLASSLQGHSLPSESGESFSSSAGCDYDHCVGSSADHVACSCSSGFDESLA